VTSGNRSHLNRLPHFSETDDGNTHETILSACKQIIELFDYLKFGSKVSKVAKV
jgi:hypothetical protein